MSEALGFLHALAQALSAMSLYSPGHPATRRSSQVVWNALVALFAVDAKPTFLFLGLAPIYNGRPLHELRDWPWSKRLSDAGVQRLELDGSVTPELITAMLERFLVRLTTGKAHAGEADSPLAGIRFGPVAVEDATPSAQTPMGGGGVAIPLEGLDDELAAMEFVWDEAARGVLARAEADAIIRILGGVLDRYQIPQAPYTPGGPRYPAVHAINTALLAMVAGSSWLDRGGRQRIGTVALLHDIGMARLPAELGDRETLTPAERAQVETHPMEGAKLLLGTGARGLELAAVVAFEHHLRPDGSGYPARRFRPAVHWASRLVGTCATFTALRAPRPFRPPWPVDRAVEFVRTNAGSVFDPEAATLLLGVVAPS
ncbi:MAG TPA: HD domain-containing phosphohydrolase [Gemmatimonadales bacterium]